MRQYFAQEECRGQAATNYVLTGAGFAALGAGLAYFLDPQQGRRRRGLVRDKAVSTVNEIGECMSKTGEYVSNHAYGLFAETRAKLRHEDVTDEQLCARVRSAMGRVVSHPKAIRVTAREGRVTLEGDVLTGEHANLLSTVGSVRGVNDVNDQLIVRSGPGRDPNLQGGYSRTAGGVSRYGIMQEYWSPTTRLLVGTAGAALGFWGIVRRDWVGCALGFLGLGFLARSSTNLPASRLVGVGAGRRAVDIQKTININAPVGEVFGFFSRYDNFPLFMRNVRRVEDHDNGFSHWVVAGPAGVRFEWDAELTEFEPHRCIAWRSVKGASVESEGRIRFDENPDGSTRVDVRMSYNPPAGAVGHALAKLFGSDPKSEMDEDLARVKTMLETGRPPRDAAEPVEQSPAEMGAGRGSVRIE
jgi:uncharacterized membrane protein